MILMLIIFVFIGYTQIPDLIKQKHWKEFVVFLFFYIVAFVLSLLYVLDVNIPSVMKGVQYVIEDILGLKY